jgi:ABC-type multidrug transport system ATPase subunit
VRVEVDRLEKRFGRVLALRDVSFALPSGQRVALIGPNGSGKSTLNRVLLGLLRYRGRVELDGYAPEDESGRASRRIAYVPQAPPDLAAPVGELVRSLCELRDVPPRAVEDLAARLELDVAEVARRPFRALSGGMKQKLLIALALAADASLLILDEPTGSLDAASRQHFYALFGELERSATLVLCSHRLEELRQLVDRVLVLDEGSVIYDGAAAGFLDASTTSVIEACADGAETEAWLASKGFRRGTGSWWVRSASRAEKLALLGPLASRVGKGLRDLDVRDLETLDRLSPGDPHPGDPHPGDPHPGDPHPGDPDPGDPHPGDPDRGDDGSADG